MYLYTKKQNENLASRFAKDKELMYPVRDAKKKNEKRDAYIKDLVSKPDFVKTYMENGNRSRKMFNKNGFSQIEKTLVLFCALAFGGVAFGIAQSEELSQPTITVTDRVVDVTFVLLVALVGAGIGFGAVKAYKEISHEDKIDNFYHRLTVRYFKKLQRIAPDVFSEEILKNCNPEMMRVISAILMANMSEQDTKKIQEIALTIPYLHDGSNVELMRKIEADIKIALKIIEKSLIDNPELGTLVRKAYKGYIPTTFVLQSQNQNIK